MKDEFIFPLRKLFPLLILLGMMLAVALSSSSANAEHDGKLQILLLGDSTTEVQTHPAIRTVPEIPFRQLRNSPGTESVFVRSPGLVMIASA
jgi:hypothetical protein